MYTLFFSCLYMIDIIVDIRRIFETAFNNIILFASLVVSGAILSWA